MDKVPEIVAELQICYATEIEIIQNYLANAVDLDGSLAEPIKALFDDEVQTALAHARRFSKRIKAMEGRVPLSVQWPREQKGVPPADRTNLVAALLRAIKSQD